MPASKSGAGRAPYRPKLLILGGTTEGSELARLCHERLGDRIDMISSLAGRTEQPGYLPGRVRIGGFGGAEGLAKFLKDEGIDLLVDATHPFAAQISANAEEASAFVGVPRLMILRASWRRHPTDRWIEVGDVAGAAAVLHRVGRRAFLTLGQDELDPFAAIRDMFFLVRVIDPETARIPLAGATVIGGRGPFTIAGEAHILRNHRIDHLVTKASGGAATEAKIVAARQLGIPVVMVRRPPLPKGERVETAAAAFGWIERRVAHLSRGLRPVSNKPETDVVEP